MKKIIIKFLKLFFNLILKIFYYKKNQKILQKFNLKTLHEEKKNETLDCPICNQNSYKSNFIYINNGFSIFEDDQEVLSHLYFLNFPDKYWAKLGFLRHILIEGQQKNFENKLVIYFNYCKSCKIYFQNFLHKEERLFRHYNFFYRRAHGDTYGRLDSLTHNEKWIEYFNCIKKDLKVGTNKRVLDIGCGEGLLCNKLNSEGFLAYGTEPSKQMSNYAKLKNIPRILNCEYSSGLYDKGFFSNIFCFHVFEHLLDIKNLINSVDFHLDNGGHLFLSVPSIENNSKIEKLKKYNCDNTIFGHDHIYLYSKEFIEKIFKKSGYDLIKSFEDQLKSYPNDLTLVFKKN